jgi:thioredoxin:protein disulfide reductase
MKLFSFSIAVSALLAAALWSPLRAQTSLNSLSAVVNVNAPEKLVAKRDQVLVADFVIQVKNGYHVNSNAPADEFLIPLRFSWNEDVVKVHEIVYPRPQMQKFPFSEKPMSVYEGDVKAQAKFKIPSSAPRGLTHLTGKLRYQACNDRMCLPPRTLEVKVPLEIRN